MSIERNFLLNLALAWKLVTGSLMTPLLLLPKLCLMIFVVFLGRILSVLALWLAALVWALCPHLTKKVFIRLSSWMWHGDQSFSSGCKIGNALFIKIAISEAFVSLRLSWHAWFDDDGA